MAEGGAKLELPQTDPDLEQYRKILLPEKQVIFDKLQEAQQNMVEPGKVHRAEGNKKFLKQLEEISNVQEFFANFELVDNQFNINDQLLIHPIAFLQLTNETRTTVLTNSKYFKNGTISRAEFNDKVEKIGEKDHIIFEYQRELAEKKVKEVFGVDDVADIKVNGAYIFADSKPFDVYRLHHLFDKECKGYDYQHLQVSKKIASELHCKDVSEYISATQYVVRKLEREGIQMKKLNPNPKRESGIKPKDHYVKIKAEEFLKIPKTIVDGFNQLREECDSANTGVLKFANLFALTNHYHNHAHFPQIDHVNNISVTRYLQIAAEMCSGPLKNPKWTQDGSSVSYEFVNTEYGAYAIRYDNIAKGTSVIATLYGRERTNPNS